MNSTPRYHLIMQVFAIWVARSQVNRLNQPPMSLLVTLPLLALTIWNYLMQEDLNLDSQCASFVSRIRRGFTLGQGGN